MANVTGWQACKLSSYLQSSSACLPKCLQELEVKYFINPLPLTICIKLLVIKCILAAYDIYQLIRVSTQTDERLSCS